ncbi:hypothetical protein P4133_05100 [Pseudomonas aeruginosa]|nr:hypothetical protein [Pseudomonas aeruginosa]
MVSATVSAAFCPCAGRARTVLRRDEHRSPAGPGILNGIAHAADGTLPSTWSPAGASLRKPPETAGTFFAGSPAIFAATARCGWTSRVASLG